MSSQSKQDKATAERNARTLRDLVKRPGNKICADCKRNDPRWASWNIGVFLCIRCSGIHRGMGTHISKVKSVDLDMWTPEQMESIKKWGNERANLYWEAHLKKGHVPPEHKMESFIRSKYESRRWAKEGPIPSDPSVLENGSVTDTPPPPPPAAQEQPVAATARKQAHVSSNSVSSRGAGFTTQQPQAHQLLSANFTKSAQIQAPSQPATRSVPPASVPAPAPQDDLFSLDFHAPPVLSSNEAPQQPKKDVKQDILSLFSSPANTSTTNPMNNQFGSALWNNPSHMQQPAQATSMIGDSGIGAWGVSSGWTPATATSVPPPQSNVWATPAASNLAPQQTDLFNTSDVWGSSSNTTSNNNTFPSNTPSQRNDAVFGDIWDSLK